MKYLGYILIAFGVADFGLSYAGVDLWGEIIGIQLPEVIWAYSGIIAAGIGYALVNISARTAASS